jgi:hypothetical protein
MDINKKAAIWGMVPLDTTKIFVFFPFAGFFFNCYSKKMPPLYSLYD